MIGNGGGDRLAAMVGFLVISDRFAVTNDITTEIDILVVKLAHFPPFFNYIIGEGGLA